MQSASRRPERVAVGLGAGGHAKSVLDALLAANSAHVRGLLDAGDGGSAELLGVPVVGDDSLLPGLAERGATHFFVGLGSVGDASQRRRLFELGCRAGLEPLTIVHPAASVSSSAALAAGAVVLAGAVVGPHARIGPNAIVNSGAIVEHDARVGAHAHVAVRATLAGGVRVGQGAHIGAAAVVLQGLTVGEGALVAAGALVIDPVEQGEVVMGVPARPAESAA